MYDIEMCIYMNMFICIMTNLRMHIFIYIYVCSYCKDDIHETDCYVGNGDDYVCIYIYIYFSCKYIYIYISCIYIYIYICIYLNKYTYIYIYICTYIYVYAHKHIYVHGYTNYMSSFQIP
jgi:hypothetical protein